MVSSSISEKYYRKKYSKKNAQKPILFFFWKNQGVTSNRTLEKLELNFSNRKAKELLIMSFLMNSVKSFIKYENKP